MLIKSVPVALDDFIYLLINEVICMKYWRSVCNYYSFDMQSQHAVYCNFAVVVPQYTV
jgi:hypothetical protein